MFVDKAYEILNLYPSLGILDKMNILLRMVFCVKPIVMVLEKYLPHQGVILDLGCGYGIISHLMVKIHPGRSVLGVDMSDHRIRVAENSILDDGNPRFFREDIRCFNFPRCDAIIAIDTLYLLPYQDQERLIRRCHENLRDDGVLIIKDNYKSRNWRYFYACTEEKLKTGMGIYGRESKGSVLHYWRIDDFLELLRNSGFEAKTIPLPWLLPYPGVFYVCHRSKNGKGNYEYS
jgi:2-polyprenyl-6-hydroxyphenyl methylase/3-demethylubiquinone-9 3-methyltransferase